MDWGVISTSSSSAIHSSAASRVRRRGTLSTTVLSLVAERMLERCFFFVGLQGMSLGREFSPTTIPS